MIQKYRKSENDVKTLEQLKNLNEIKIKTM